MRSRETFYSSNACESESADALHADRSAICWVLKVRNLILHINLKVKDVHTGALAYGKSVDLRGNTDIS